MVHVCLCVDYKYCSFNISSSWTAASVSDRNVPALNKYIHIRTQQMTQQFMSSHDRF